jgi:hypothetical protein
MSDETLQSESGSTYQQDASLLLPLENKKITDHAASPELYKQESETPSHPLAWQDQSPIATNIIVTDTATAPRPCRVAVTNSFPAHYETLESIASLFPLDAIQLPQQCNSKIIQFDYYLKEPSAPGRRTHWIDFFETTLKGTKVSMPQADNVTRYIGELHLQPAVRGQLTPSRSEYLYDAIIEATCYCYQRRIMEWMMAESGRSCIFHDRCPEAVADPRAVWLSPMHKKYYIPTVLPGSMYSQLQPQQRPLQLEGTPHKLCVVGTTKRRDWGLLKGYLESTLGAIAAASSRFTIQIFGNLGGYPEALEGYRNMTTMESPEDDRDFYLASSQCDGLLLLVSKEKQPAYFNITDGRQMMSGAIPSVIAFQLPVVLHEEQYAVYQDQLSSITHATHSDSAPSFNAAMNQLLDTLDTERKHDRAFQKSEAYQK